MSKRPILRQTATAVCDWWTSNQGGGRPANQERPADVPTSLFFCVNSSTFPIAPGDTLLVVGFRPSTISYQNAYRKILNNKIKLDVAFAAGQAGEDDMARVIALTPAPPRGHIFKAASPDSTLYFAHVLIPDTSGIIPDSSYHWVDIDGEALNTEEGAYARIIAKTNKVNGYVVAICQRLQEEGLSLEEVDDEIDSKISNIAFNRASAVQSLSISNNAITFTTSSSFVTGIQNQ